jgi:hypothetical protein
VSQCCCKEIICSHYKACSSLGMLIPQFWVHALLLYVWCKPDGFPAPCCCCCCCLPARYGNPEVLRAARAKADASLAAALPELG